MSLWCDDCHNEQMHQSPNQPTPRVPGKKATMVIRQGPDGRALLEGEQVQVGGNERYVSLCRMHFREATGDACRMQQLTPLTPVVISDCIAMDSGGESPG